jgi:hypothetical protein
MKKIFSRLRCRIYGHTWWTESGYGSDCIWCKKHRPWINLDIMSQLTFLNDNLGDKADVDLYEAFKDSCYENHEFLRLKHFNFCNGCGVKL